MNFQNGFLRIGRKWDLLEGEKHDDVIVSERPSAETAGIALLLTQAETDGRACHSTPLVFPI